MPARRQGSFDVNAAIEPQINLPLDARSHVRNKDERLDPGSYNTDYIYKGMIVASRDEEKLFFLVDHNNPTLEASWKEIGPYDDSELRRLINEVDNRITDQTIEGGTGISVVKEGDNYTIINTAPNDNTCCEELSIRLDNQTITGGTGISVTKQGDNYTITNTSPGGGMDFLDDYMVISKSPNIIITARGEDGDTPNLFTYDVLLAGADAENNQLIEFETGKDKIRIRKTILPEGPLTAWATSGAGIYYNASTGIISYNDGTTTKTIVKVDDSSTVVPGDVLIMDSGSTPLPMIYTVTFNPNGGSVTPTSAQTGSNGKLASLPTPTHASETFTGWFTAATGGTAVTTNTVFTQNTTVFAQWQAATVDLPVFATVSSLTSMDEVAVDYTQTEQILSMPAQTETNPIIIEVPTEKNFVLTMWNPLINQWVETPNKWDVSTTTRTIGGNEVAYTRYTENCECDSGAIEIRLTWTV